MASKRILILDSFSITYRAFFGLPTTIRTRQGQAINAALGFYNTLSSLLNQIQPHFVAVASDCKAATFRHDLFPSYKAQRPPMPDELKGQLPLIRQLVGAAGIPIFELPGYEADDVIGTLSVLLPPDTEAFIATTDRDALQLVNPKVSILVPSARENRIYTPETVEHEYHVKPAHIPDLKALMGDASDNIPGVPKVGPKTATKWLQTYGTLENLLQHRHELKGKVGESLRSHSSEVVLYKQLATIDKNVPLLFCWQALTLTRDFAPLREALETIGIRAPLPQTG